MKLDFPNSFCLNLHINEAGTEFDFFWTVFKNHRTNIISIPQNASIF